MRELSAVDEVGGRGWRGSFSRLRVRVSSDCSVEDAGELGRRYRLGLGGADKIGSRCGRAQSGELGLSLSV